MSTARVLRRYNPTAQALHWLTALLMFTVVPLAWVMVNMAKSDPSRGSIFMLHKSFGLTILAIVAVRLGWRVTHPAPPLPAGFERWNRAMAFASHWLLYLILLGMPISGYILSSAAHFPVTYFGIFTLPGLPKNMALAHAATWVHVGLGQWLVYGLVALHVLATAWHVAIRRDGVLNRMLPEQNIQTQGNRLNGSGIPARSEV